MRRGDIFAVDFGAGTGREVSGVCPAVVVSSDASLVGPVSVTVVPGSSTAAITFRSMGVNVPAVESGLPTDANFLCYLVRGVDVSRVGSGPLGRLPAARMADIDRILRSILDLHQPAAPARRQPPPP